jgi:hypothetical protein
MRKLIYLVVAGLSITSLVGCNRGWPSCFCNNNNDACEAPSADCCEPNAAYYYGASDGTYQVVPQTETTPVPALPTPGPDTNAS